MLRTQRTAVSVCRDSLSRRVLGLEQFATVNIRQVLAISKTLKGEPSKKQYTAKKAKK
jgi:hypothetical protein